MGKPVTSSTQVTPSKQQREKMTRLIIRRADNSYFASLTIYGTDPDEVESDIRARYEGRRRRAV